MPKLSKFDKALKYVNKTASAAPAINIVAGLVISGATIIAQTMNNMEQKIDVSDICAKDGHPTSLAEAKDYLERINVKSMEFPIKYSEADPKYRNCIDNQVVDVRPRGRVAADDTLRLYYVTQDVIDRSKELFEEEQARLKIQAEEKEAKRAEQKAKTKAATAEAVGAIKQGVGKLSSALRSKTKMRGYENE